MDPLHPITPAPPGIPVSRVPPVDRLVKITRDGDRPDRDEEERRRRALRARAESDDQDPGEGHIDIRV